MRSSSFLAAVMLAACPGGKGQPVDSVPVKSSQSMYCEPGAERLLAAGARLTAVVAGRGLRHRSAAGVFVHQSVVRTPVARRERAINPLRALEVGVELEQCTYCTDFSGRTSCNKAACQDWRQYDADTRMQLQLDAAPLTTWDWPPGAVEGHCSPFYAEQDDGSRAPWFLLDGGGGSAEGGDAGTP